MVGFLEILNLQDEDGLKVAIVAAGSTLISSDLGCDELLVAAEGRGCSAMLDQAAISKNMG